MQDRSHIMMQHNSTVCVSNWSVRCECMVQHNFFRGEKHKIRHFQSPSTIFYATFYMLTQQNTILKFDTSVLGHTCAATIHPLSKCKKGMLLHHRKYALTNITHVACQSSFSVNGIHFAQTFLLPTCFRRMQNMLTVDIPTSAAIAVHVMLLSSSGTAPTCSTSLICHGCRRTTASSITHIFPPPTMAFTTISSTDLYTNKMSVSTSHAVNNSKPSYCQTSNTAFSNTAHFLQWKELIHNEKMTGLQLKTVIFSWWWWLQLIYHSAKNVCLHQLTNSNFPCNSYFICKSIWNFYPFLYCRPMVKISCSETS